MLTCGRCGGAYAATRRNSAAYLSIGDHRCNHVTATCALCGRDETVFLTPEQFKAAVDGGGLTLRLSAVVDGDLRARAERAWAAVTKDDDAATSPDPEPTVPVYELTDRLRRELDRFTAAVESMPDDLLWDALTIDQGRTHPDRWIT